LAISDLASAHARRSSPTETTIPIGLGAYEAFGEAIAQTWLTGSFLFTTDAGWDLQTHLGLLRTQRKFEDESRHVMAALSTTLLYASDETRDAADVLAKAATGGFRAMSEARNAGADTAEAQRQAGTVFTKAVLAWRKAALADLTR
jgi:hypothetical protein